MALINRLCCILFILVLLAAGGVLLLDLFGLTVIVDNAYALFSSGVYSRLLLVCGAILFLLGLLLLLAKLFIRPPKKAKIPAAGQRDAVYITLATLEDMAKNTAINIPGVIGVHPKVKVRQGGLIVNMRVRVSYEDQVTAITSRLQDDVKLVIEASTTLPVHHVNIYVTKAAGDTSADALRANSMQTVPAREVTAGENVEEFQRE